VTSAAAKILAVARFKTSSSGTPLVNSFPPERFSASSSRHASLSIFVRPVRIRFSSFFVCCALALIVQRLDAAPAQTDHSAHQATPEGGTVAGGRLGDLSTAQPASTRKMSELIHQIWSKSNPIENFYLSFEAADFTRMMMMRPGAAPDLRKIELLHQYMLQAGETEAVLQDLERLEAAMKGSGAPLPASLEARFTKFKAIGYLRLGEQENCLHNHNGDSCLLPIRGGGVHKMQRGSQKAAENFTRMLQQNPHDLQARWLLNIAHMTLGDYPQAIPEAWRIDPQVFASDYDIKRFPDVAGALGLAVDDLAGAVVMEDFDRDGLLDLLVTASGPRSLMRVFRNQGDGTFVDRTAAAGLAGLSGGLNAMQTDYNNDGFKDVLVLRTGWLRKEGHHPNSLLRNNGDFTFTDVTEEAKLLSFRPTQTAAWFDYNGDGWLDVFIGNESTPDDPHPSELYRNNGDGTFTECAAANGLSVAAYVKGVTAGDFNNDGRPDLYLSLQHNDNILFRNDGAAEPGSTPDRPWRFTDVAVAAGVTEPKVSFPCWFWDYDNDGWLDLMVMGYLIKDSGDIAADYLGLPNSAEKPRLYLNNRDGTFRDITAASGLNKVLHTMGCNFGDLDNDGWLDFYAGTGDPNYTTLLPNRMFRNDAGKGFQDVTTSGGFGQLQKGHGIAFGDIDNDGDQDVYQVIGGVFAGDHYPNQLLANPGHGNHWLKLELTGVTSNRAAIGARIKVVIATESGERALHKTVSHGTSFGASPLRQEFGLGAAERILRVEIFWPATGVTQVVKDLEIDRYYRISEDAVVATQVQPATFELPSGSASDSAHHRHASAH
jgi:hypothetical protein